MPVRLPVSTPTLMFAVKDRLSVEYEEPDIVMFADGGFNRPAVVEDKRGASVNRMRLEVPEVGGRVVEGYGRHFDRPALELVETRSTAGRAIQQCGGFSSLCCLCCS